jgi:TetR/AcrR family transcriptional repressor of nem operon
MIFIEAFFRRCVAAGQKDGSIIGTRRADEVAKLLLSVLLGIRVLARSRPQREVLEGAANGALAILGTRNTRNTSRTTADIAPEIAAGFQPHSL